MRKKRIRCRFDLHPQSGVAHTVRDVRAMASHKAHNCLALYQCFGVKDARRQFLAVMK